MKNIKASGRDNLRRNLLKKGNCLQFYVLKGAHKCASEHILNYFFIAVYFKILKFFLSF